MTNRSWRQVFPGLTVAGIVSAGLPSFFYVLLDNRETVVQKGAADG
jgi:hypothetical protein